MHEWQETKNAVRPDSNSPLCQVSRFLSWTHVTMACYASTIDSIRYRIASIWKKKEEEEEERGNGEKRKEKKRKARYVDTSRVVSFYDRYRRTNGPRIETQRTAARDFCRVGEREGEKKEEEKGLLPTGRNMNSRLAYFFRDVRRKLWKRINLRGDVIPINLHKVYQKELLLQSYVIEKIGGR